MKIRQIGPIQVFDHYPKENSFLHAAKNIINSAYNLLLEVLCKYYFSRDTETVFIVLLRDLENLRELENLQTALNPTYPHNHVQKKLSEIAKNTKKTYEDLQHDKDSSFSAALFCRRTSIDIEAKEGIFQHYSQDLKNLRNLSKNLGVHISIEKKRHFEKGASYSPFKALFLHLLKKKMNMFELMYEEEKDKIELIAQCNVKLKTLQIKFPTLVSRVVSAITSQLSRCKNNTEKIRGFASKIPDFPEKVIGDDVKTICNFLKLNIKTLETEFVRQNMQNVVSARNCLKEKLKQLQDADSKP